MSVGTAPHTLEPEEPDEQARSWPGHIAHSLNVVRGDYMRAWQRRPARTALLTLLALLAVSYPLLNRAFLQQFSRNVFSLPFPDDTVVVFMLIFAAMAIGLNIVIGFAGLLDLGYVAFYAFGAYTVAYMSSPHWSAFSIVVLADVPQGYPGIHFPFWIVFPAAALVAASFGALLGAPTLRLRGDYLAIVTLGFGEIVPIVFRNLVNVNFEFGPIKLVNANLTGGPLGINPVDPPSLFGVKFGVIHGFNAVYLAMFVVVLCIIIARNLERSRMGRAWIAIREDETAAEMMGINTVRTKLLAFGLGASFAGFAGALQSSYQGATTSDFFQFATSIIVVVMIILGGMGNIWGALLGALTLQWVDKTALTWLGNQLNAVGRQIGSHELSIINPAQFNFLIFGVALVLMMRFRPEGLLPSRQRAAELHHAPPDQTLGSAGVIAEEVVDEIVEVDNDGSPPPDEADQPADRQRAAGVEDP